MQDRTDAAQERKNKKTEGVESHPSQGHETWDKDEEVNKCLKVAKQWAWDTVELGARTGVLVSRQVYSSVCSGGSYVRDLVAPLWLNKRAVSRVQDSLGVNQQAGNDSDADSFTTQPDRLSSAAGSPCSPVSPVKKSVVNH